MFKTKEEKIGIKVTVTVLAIWLVILLIFLRIDTGFHIASDILTLITVSDMLTLLSATLSAIFWGAKAGKRIIKYNKHDDYTGIKTVFLIWLIVFITNYLLNTNFSKGTTDTYHLVTMAKVFLLYLFIPTIPLIITGIIIGRRIKKIGEKYKNRY